VWALLLALALLQPVVAWALLPGRAAGEARVQSAFVNGRTGVEWQAAPAAGRLRAVEVKLDEAALGAVVVEAEPPARHWRAEPEERIDPCSYVPARRPVRGPPSLLC